MYFSVDNPAGGDCAFYAYAIALIDIIKHEFHKNPVQSKTFDRWCGARSAIKNYEGAIRSFDYDHQDDEVLLILQKSLREIVFSHQYKELLALDAAQDIILATIQQPVFCKFSEIFWHFYLGSDLDPNYNVLSSSVDVKKFAKAASVHCEKTIPAKEYSSREHNERINTYLAKLFSHEIYGPNYQDQSQRCLQTESIIIQALGRVMVDREMAKRKGVSCYWGTHGDLNILSEAFAVNLHYLVNGKKMQHFEDIPSRAVAIIDNLDNAHWITRITTSKLEYTPRTQRYQAYVTDGLLSKDEVRQLFKTYTKGPTAFFHRHHLSMAREIIAACKNPSKSIDDVVELIKGYTTDSTIHFNLQSSFMKRATYILVRREHYNDAEVDDESVCRLDYV